MAGPRHITPLQAARCPPTRRDPPLPAVNPGSDNCPEGQNSRSPAVNRSAALTPRCLERDPIDWIGPRFRFVDFDPIFHAGSTSTSGENALALRKREQIRVYLILQSRAHAMGRTLVDFESRVLDQFRGKQC